MRHEHLSSPEAFDRFLAGFESGTLPKIEWTHGAHIAAAANYLFGSDVVTVLPLMRHRIRTYNIAVGGANTETSGYHETLTHFWLIIIASFLHGFAPSSRLEAARLAVAEFGQLRSLHTHYYSGNVVTDSFARREWRVPDLQPLPTIPNETRLPAHPLN